MNQSVNDPVTLWIRDLKTGDDDAPNQLWNHYFEQLVALAKSRMRHQPSRVADEEDVALSVFKSLCRGAENGRFTQITDRDDLWILLITMTKRKVVNQIRWDLAQKRGGGEVRGESVFEKTGLTRGLDQIIDGTPTAEFAEQLNEEYQRLLDSLGDEMLSTIAIKRMEGYSDNDIADELGVAPRTVRRKLSLIRNKWDSEVST